MQSNLLFTMRLLDMNADTDCSGNTEGELSTTSGYYGLILSRIIFWTRLMGESLNRSVRFR